MNPPDRHSDPQPRIVGLISNPNSRRNRKGLHKVEAIVANRPDIHHRVTAGVEDIATVLSEFAALGANVLAINGGDGTGAQVLTELLEGPAFPQPPAIVLLPGGTTNMNAADTGLRGSLPASVQRLAAWTRGNATGVEHLTRPVLRVDGASDGRPLYGMFFGTGTIVNGIEYCHRNIHTRGIGDELAPGLVVLRTLWGMLRGDARFARPTGIDIDIDACHLGKARPVVQLLVTSLQRLFLGLRPWWGAEYAPLHCTWMEHPTRRVLRAFPALLRGRPNRHLSNDNGYYSHNGERIDLLLDGSFTLDGEIYQAVSAAGPLTISVGATLGFLRIGHGA